MSALDDLIARDAGAAQGGSALDALIIRDGGKLEKPAVQAEPAKETTDNGFLGQIKHQLGLTARAGVTTLTSLPNMLGDATNGAINLGIHGINSAAGTNIHSLKYPSQITQDAMNSAGVSQPQNTQERIVQAMTSAAGSTGPSVALGNLLAKLLAKSAAPVAQAVATGLTAAPGVQAVSATGAGLGGQGAAEMGLGPAGQIAGAILGGGGTALAATGVKSLAGESVAQSQARRYASALRDRVENIVPGGASKLTPPSPGQSQVERYAEALNDSSKNPVQSPLPSIDKPRLKLNTDGTTTNLADAPASPLVFKEPATLPKNIVRPIQSQLDTIALLKKIGLEDQRPATISGDKFASGIDYENAKLANPLGEATRAQLAKEQTALKTYATDILHKTGGQAATPEAVGQTIRTPMQDLSTHFDTQISGLYDAAKTKAGGMGAVDPKSLNALMNNNEFRETLLSSTDGTALLGSIERQVKRFQGVPIAGEELAAAPNTVNSAENLRKWLNSQWSPTNSRMLGQVKQALDLDVATAGGSGVFDKARQLHKLRMDTLDNPNGISKLLTMDGPNGINQAIPDEFVGPKLLTMPKGQFEHIVKTLKGMPESLQPSGQQAIAEIKAELMRKIYKAGDSGGTQNGPSIWNAANVTRELDAQKSKLAIIFSRDELDQIKTLHDAGHVIQTPMAYKGAAAQGYNYIQKGVLTGLPAGGAGLGAILGGPLGATAGSAVGAAASTVAKERIDNTMAQRFAEQLRNHKPTFAPE